MIRKHPVFLKFPQKVGYMLFSRIIKFSSTKYPSIRGFKNMQCFRRLAFSYVDWNSATISASIKSVRSSLPKDLQLGNRKRIIKFWVMKISTLFWISDRNRSNSFLREFIFSCPTIFFSGFFKGRFEIYVIFSIVKN